MKFDVTLALAGRVLYRVTVAACDADEAADFAFLALLDAAEVVDVCPAPR
jgi:hypothetical protein